MPVSSKSLENLRPAKPKAFGRSPKTFQCEPFTLEVLDQIALSNGLDWGGNPNRSEALNLLAGQLNIVINNPGKQLRVSAQGIIEVVNLPD